jgi:hypothetical protein
LKKLQYLKKKNQRVFFSAIVLSAEVKKMVLPDVTRRATQMAKIASFDVILTDALQD